MFLGLEIGVLIRWLGFLLAGLLTYQGVSGYFMRRSRVPRVRRGHRWIGVALLTIAAMHGVAAIGFH
jgi:hypothetical protein